MRHADNHNILYLLQHGFRDRRSCETQLLGFVNDLVNTMHAGSQTDILVMDFSKAFDKVSHLRLVTKLKYYGIGGRTNRWVQSFLTGRTQRVVLEGESSDDAEVLSGVPQGSVLGPCLFLFYINDLPESLVSNIRLFADDTIVYLTIHSDSDTQVLQRDKLAEWEILWKMEFHPDKCEVLGVGRKRAMVQNDYILHGKHLYARDGAASGSEICPWQIQHNHITLRLCMMYKIHEGLIAMDAQEFMTPLQRRSRHVNSNAYEIPRSKTDYHMYSFFPRTIREWDSLANGTVKAPNLTAFKKSLPSDQALSKRC
ncbi:hypothetical protein ACROYT_G007837 [Oculina patagonica]